MADRTKRLLADKLMELGKQKPFQKIQVRELCAACGLDRTTFYRHFRDKYDLVSWIYQQYFEAEEETAPFSSWEEMLCRINTRLYRDKRFFANALLDPSQNNLREHMLEFHASANRDILCRYLGTKTLDEETAYDLQSYMYATMGHTIDWLTDRLPMTPERYSYHQYRSMPEILKRAWTEFPSGR